MIPAVDRSSPVWRMAAGLFALLWCVSLALPVYGATLASPPAKPFELRGWQVLYMAPMMLVWGVTLPWLANLTGFATFLMAARGRRPPAGLALLSFAIAASLLIWWRPFGVDATSASARELRIGCWVWLASFLPLAAIDAAFLLRSVRSARLDALPPSS